MTKGTPMASGGKAAAWAKGIKIGEIDIDDWWTEGYKAGDAASLAVQGTPGAAATSIFVTATRGDGTTHTNLSLNVATFRDAVYNKGWNDAIDACAQNAVDDAYHAVGEQSLSGKTPYSNTHSYPASTNGGSHTVSGEASWSYSYTPTQTKYTGLYTLAAKK